jgi:spore germination cell wall hydrolase CwlJ-like protein
LILPAVRFVQDLPRLVLVGAIAALAVLVGLIVLGANGDPEHRGGGRAVASGPLAAPPEVKPVELVDISPDDARAVNAKRAFSTAPFVIAPALIDRRSELDRDRATDCLAAAAWYEAGDDPIGERSVIQVVLNRARHPAFPRNVCGVVFQGSDRPTGCQFTFTCDGALHRIPSPPAWTRARTLAKNALAGVVDKDVGLATHYHTDWVLPVWSAKLEKIAKVRTHLFFRWPGPWGGARAFRPGLAAGEPQIAALGRISPIHYSEATELLAQADGSDEDARPPSALAPVRFTDHRVSDGAGNADDVFFVALDAAKAPGSYAISAVNLCGKRPRCLILGWLESARISKQLPLPQGALMALSFVYRRTAPGEDAAYWDCMKMQRADDTQCLPRRLIEVQVLVNRP